MSNHNLKIFENPDARVILKKGRAKSLKNFHPWIYSGAIQRVEGDPLSGDIVSVYSNDGYFQAKGFYNPHSTIQVRVLSFKEDPIDLHFFEDRISRAVEFRRSFILPHTNAYRLINGDADGLSGLVVDRYADVLVVQITSAGMDRLREVIVDILKSLLHPSVIVERSDSPSRQEEGLPLKKEMIWGNLDANNKIMIRENNIQFWVDVWNGQKTGFFLDQRDNRWKIGELAAGRKLLNCFAYTGGFSVYAALKGAITCSVEISESALHLARENFVLNGIDPQEHEFIADNVFDYLRETTEMFDLIVLDPPAFVKKKSHLKQGARGYKDINRLAMKLIREEGLLLSCSCSHYVDWKLFQQILFAAAREAERKVQIIGKFGQPPDHPVSIYHPEGEYLKSILLRVYG